MVRSKFLVGLLGIFLFCLTFSCVFAVSSEEAQAAINRAESKVILAYKSALEAEKDGVDISSLLVKLNDSSLLLSEAQMQYRLGNFSEATYFANQCYDSLYGIETEAEGLRDYAAVARKQGMLISVIGSSLGICAIYFGSLIGWRFFNTRYHKRVLEMKPEVQANDSK